MAYYMRYISTTTEPITFESLHNMMIDLEGGYLLKRDTVDDERAELTVNGVCIADLEINSRGDQLFDEDIEDLLELLSFLPDSSAGPVVDVLNAAQSMLVAAVYWQGDDPDPVFSLLDPIWDWLFGNLPGLLQADNEGFYDAERLILEMHTKI